MSEELTVEKILEIVCPQIKYAKCNHKDEQDRFDYWSADSGLCWCNKCGICMNGRWEYVANFQDWKADAHYARTGRYW